MNNLVVIANFLNLEYLSIDMACRMGTEYINVCSRIQVLNLIFIHFLSTF